jgi:hypothetical protein
MNDFTKNELKELMFGLWCRAKLDGTIINKTLYDKLKSLADNYCEHKRCDLGECGDHPEECLRCNK